MIGFWACIIGLSLLCSVWLFGSAFKLSKKTPVIIALLLIPMLSSILYWRWGDSVQVASAMSAKAEIKKVDAEVRKLGTRGNVIDMLKKQVEKRPDDAKGWYLLGKLYLGGGELKDAERCLKRANLLDKNNPNITIALVESQFYLANKKLSSSSKKQLKQLLKSDPQQINAVNLLALDAYNRHQYQDAVNYWERLLPLFPAESENAKAVLKMIASAQKNLQ